MLNLKKHLLDQQRHWLDILNNNYKTDSGGSYAECAKGRLAAYTELLNLLSKDEEKDEGTTAEKRRFGKAI